MMTEIVAGVDIADVHFDGRNFHCRQSVVQGDRGVRIAAGIDDDPGGLFGVGLVDEIDQFALAIGLPAIGLQPELCRGVGAQFLDVGERRMAVGLGLAGPQQIEVRAVKHVDGLGMAYVGEAFGHSNPGNMGCGWPGL